MSETKEEDRPSLSARSGHQEAHVPYRVDVVQCRGTPYAVGVQQAQAFLQTPRGRAFPRRRERRPFAFSFQDARIALETYSPVVWAELHGIADQMEISLERAAGEFSNGRLRFPKRGCSAVVSDGVYGRNYDYSLQRYDRTLVAMQAEGAYSSIAFGDRLTGRLDGMNEHGLCVGLHYVNISIAKPGLSCILIVRIVLDQCATTAEAEAVLRRLPHGLGYNYSLLDATGDAAVVEAGPGEVSVRRGEWLACTNHFQSASMAQLNRRATGRSRARLPPLEALGRQRLPAAALFQALNDSQSPAFHHGYSKGFGTLHTLVGEPAARRLLVGVGGDATPTVLDVRQWAAGRPLPVTAIEGQLGGVTKPFSPSGTARTYP